MFYVYLDQAKWIDLAHAAHGDPASGRFADALRESRLAVAERRVAFPLSSGHYIETWRHSNDGRRGRLAATMSELSRHVTMASPPVLCNSEIDQYLHDRFGSPESPRVCPVFGRGLAHTTEYAPVASTPYAPSIENKMLAHRPEGFLPHGRGRLDFAEAYAASEQELANALPSLSKFKDYTLAATAVAEISANISDALARAGLPPDLLMEFLVAEAEEFIAALPTRAAALRLREARHRNRQKAWERNDMNDVAYNACAVVHCDLVVTEKLWAEMLRQSHIAEDHGTIVLTDLTELPTALSRLTAT